jgi:hypothetical protein
MFRLELTKVRRRRPTDKGRVEGDLSTKAGLRRSVDEGPVRKGSLMKAGQRRSTDGGVVELVAKELI